MSYGSFVEVGIWSQSESQLAEMRGKLPDFDASCQNEESTKWLDLSDSRSITLSVTQHPPVKAQMSTGRRVLAACLGFGQFGGKFKPRLSQGQALDQYPAGRIRLNSEHGCQSDAQVARTERQKEYSTKL